jgi:hypothetical protein
VFFQTTIYLSGQQHLNIAQAPQGYTGLPVVTFGGPKDADTIVKLRSRRGICVATASVEPEAAELWILPDYKPGPISVDERARLLRHRVIRFFGESCRLAGQGANSLGLIDAVIETDAAMFQSLRTRFQKSTSQWGVCLPTDGIAAFSMNRLTYENGKPFFLMKE